MAYRFSVIIPVYNTELYLKGCIESLLLQSYDNFEIILIDDGSTDSSGLICDEYVKRYPYKIKCIHKDNEGLLMTRLRGYKEAVGDYILNLDSDDEFRLDALSILDSCITKTDSDLILFQASIDNNYTELWPNSRLELESGTVLAPSFLKKLICSGPSINNMAFKCAKKSLFVNIQKLSVYSGMNNEEDLMQSLQLIDKCKKPFYIAEMLYYYRQTNTTSISNNFNPRIFDSIKTSGDSVSLYANQWKDELPGLNTIVYSRQIKSCAALIRYYFERSESRKQIDAFLYALKRDEFFINSYKNGNKENLSILEKTNLFNLYHGWVELIFAVMNIRGIIKKEKYLYKMK